MFVFVFIFVFVFVFGSVLVKRRHIGVVCKVSQLRHSDSLSHHSISLNTKHNHSFWIQRECFFCFGNVYLLCVTIFSVFVIMCSNRQQKKQISFIPDSAQAEYCSTFHFPYLCMLQATFLNELTTWTTLTTLTTWTILTTLTTWTTWTTWTTLTTWTT